MIEVALDTQYMDPRMVDATVANESIVRFRDRQLSCQSYKAAVIYPGKSREGTGGVIDCKGRFVPNTSVYNDCLQAGADLNSPVEDSHRSVVYLGMLYGCWGHCLTDCLQRMWILGDERLKSKTLVYTTSDWRRGLPKNFYDLLEVLGLHREQMVEITKPTRFDEIIVPDSCFFTNVNSGQIEYTKEYADIIEKLRIKGNLATRKVYFSRSKWGNGGGNIGEECFEKFFRRKGYEIVYPEKLDFLQLRTLLSETKELAATEGSVAHNSIFLPTGSLVTIIRKVNFLNRWQPVINEVAGIVPRYIDSHFSHLLFSRKNPMMGPFFLYVNSRMAKFLGVRSHFPVLTYFRYLYYFCFCKARSAVWRLRYLMGV